MKVLNKHRAAIGYTLDDLKGISPTLCQHKINMEPDAKPVVDHQRRLNPKMKEVVRTEILKLLEAGIIYPIAYSRWVSHVHCVPKNGGITVVPNDKNELIPQRIVTGYRMVIDFRKLNKATRKDHYPLSTHTFAFLMDILVSLKYLYHSLIKRKRPLLALLELMLIDVCLLVYAMHSDFCEKIVEVFIDDFSIYGTSFDDCLSNLDRVLQRCEQTNLVLNWEKCHFVMNEGIVLGHKISE